MINDNITIHVVDDDPQTSQFLKELVSTINYQTQLYSCADEFLNQFKNDGVGCLILDLRLPGINGLELHNQLIKNNINLPVIMVTGYGDIPTAVKAMKAGILDFIEKPFRSKLMIDLIHKAVKQHQAILDNKQADDEIKSLIDSLTKRENEVRLLVVQGLHNKDIATKLGISIKTVEVHRANAMSKMHANSIAELVRMCMQVNDTGIAD